MRRGWVDPGVEKHNQNDGYTAQSIKFRDVTNSAIPLRGFSIQFTPSAPAARQRILAAHVLE